MELVFDSSKGIKNQFQSKCVMVLLIHFMTR